MPPWYAAATRRSRNRRGRPYTAAGRLLEPDRRGRSVRCPRSRQARQEAPRYRASPSRGNRNPSPNARARRDARGTRTTPGDRGPACATLHRVRDRARGRAQSDSCLVSVRETVRSIKRGPRHDSTDVVVCRVAALYSQRMATFIVQPHFRLQEWVAEEKRYFTDEGLDYEFRETVRSSDGKAHIGNRRGAFQLLEEGVSSNISCACHWTVDVAAAQGHGKLYSHV